ncbi:hypothetical protein [Clostridium uliginosum]|uniref:Lipoprotein n=1 Tax=Clostridium uliginosum TaxID=119641 RepID=A0A1I1IAW9_9CLOT|nr:hypothetical protein [Clostridium uliginosum]SFC30420.1 hypothetical protein SAMN05421842_10299 [Clostridium uliginosum]
MSKRICGIIMSLIIAASLIGCGNSETQNTEQSNNSKGKTEQSSDDENLKGSWSEDYSLDQTKSFFNSYLTKMENITKEFELKYSKDETVKKENDQTINDNSIYFDNKNPEPNRIESMYFGMKIYGEDLSSGDIELKLSLKFDSKDTIKNQDFDLGKTSFNKYIAAFTGKEKRDYSSINKQIIDGLKEGKSDIIIKDSIDGLKEEITVSKDYILYKLATKKYDFTKPNTTLK